MGSGVSICPTIPCLGNFSALCLSHSTIIFVHGQNGEKQIKLFIWECLQCRLNLCPKSNVNHMDTTGIQFKEKEVKRLKKLFTHDQNERQIKSICTICLCTTFHHVCGWVYSKSPSFSPFLYVRPLQMRSHILFMWICCE